MHGAFATDIQKVLASLNSCAPAVSTWELFYWYGLSFGPVEGDSLIRVVCAASVLISIGIQLMFSAFLMLLLDQPRKYAQ
jgi:hypothetical protein